MGRVGGGVLSLILYKYRSIFPSFRAKNHATNRSNISGALLSKKRSSANTTTSLTSFLSAGLFLQVGLVVAQKTLLPFAVFTPRNRDGVCTTSTPIQRGDPLKNYFDGLQAAHPLAACSQVARKEVLHAGVSNLFG